MSSHQLVSRLILRSAAVVGSIALGVQSAGAVDLFVEDFEGLTLKPVVTFESELREREAWQEVGPDGPAGWTELNLTAVNPLDPGSGVTEFAGWRFVNKDWWVLTAGDQGRSNFLSGSGIVAVADPDEWDDFGDPAGDEGDLDPANGVFDSTLITPSVSLGGVAAGQAKLFFNSSWLPEDQQTGTLTAVYDRGSAGETVVPLLRLASDSDDLDFKEDALDENLVLDLQNPAGASTVEVEFRLQGNNDWWWAVDNVRVFTGAEPGEDGVLRTIVNRDTGEVKMVNNTGATVDLRGYSIRSNAGAFDEAGAIFLADSESGWLQATQEGGEINDLSEVHLNSDPLAAGGEINFGEGVWAGFYSELADLTFDYLIAGNDNQIEGTIEFVGNNDTNFEFLDLNFDGAIDILDWETFKTGYGTDIAGLTEAFRYAKSDLNNDGFHSLEDYVEFQRVYETVNGAGSFATRLSGGNNVPEPSSILLVAGLGLCVLAVRRMPQAAVLLVLVATLVGAEVTQAQLVLLDEDFEGIVLEDPIEEAGAGGNDVVTRTPPTGWTIDNSGIPGLGNPDTDGIVDWAGWAFADKDWWTAAAGDQNRSFFTRGQGTIMVADPDEWDDAANPVSEENNLYDTFIKTQTINIPAGVPAGRIQLSFDSSWRDEADGNGADSNQTATLNVSYNGSSSIEVLRWESSTESDFFKDDAENERIELDLQYDGSASSLQLEFGLGEADNDWWWAVDNLLVSVPTDPAVLRINTANGQAFFAGDDVIPSSVNGIDVRSASGKLRSVVGGGLSSAISQAADGPDSGGTAGDSSGEQWEGLTSTESQFSEAFLFGDSSFDSSRSEFLGQLLDPSQLNSDPNVAAANSDLQFSYSLATGAIVEGVVEYFYEEVSLPGDFNGDGFVNFGDYAVWRDNLGAANEDSLSGNGNGSGGVTAADYQLWKSNFGNTASSGSLFASEGANVPEPAAATLLLLAGTLLLSRRFGSKMAPLCVIGFLGVSLSSGVAEAVDPPTPFIDRDYGFGDDDTGATVGQPVSQTDGSGNIVTYDGAGNTGQNQLIDLIVEGNTASRKATYVSTTDRPDGAGGIGIQLNPAIFDRQYLRTGFGEALNFPEQSPSSAASLVNNGGTLNYFRINDRGFQLWAKPTAVAGEHHIVMDSQQHGVLIDEDGNFAMRYGSQFEVETTQEPGPDGELGTEDDILTVSDAIVTPANYASDVAAQPNEWYHLSVVRPFGPNQGSIFYINGVAEAIAFGTYAVETIVNIGEGDLFTNIDSLDVSPLTVGRATNAESLTLPPTESFFFRGVVDDLEMFVLGLNDDDNLPGGGTNQLNDYGEFIFERDNGYAQAFAPAVDGDITGGSLGTPDGVVDLEDAAAFAANWLFENRLSAVNPFTETESSRLVGDLTTRARGDFNYDGIVDLDDWAILNNQNPAAGAAALRLIGSANVPEPSTALLLALAAGGLGIGLRRVRG